MPHKRIGALTIGQSPRNDLVAPLAELLPECEIVQVGALDGLVLEELPDPKGAAYPLVTRMRSGDLVMVAEDFITPRLQNALEKLENQGVASTLLMCAGTFAELKGSQPLLKPFDIGKGVLHTLGLTTIGLLAPVPEQEAPIRLRWDAAGWDTTVWTANLGKQDQAFLGQINKKVVRHNLECIVLDYFGHPIEWVTNLQDSVDIPVLDLGYLATVTLANLV